MNVPRPARLVFAAVCLFPTLLAAHPGHYHPDETDEFDFLRAALLHPHGALDLLLAAVVVSSVAVAFLNHRPDIRIGALVAATGSLALVPFLN